MENEAEEVKRQNAVLSFLGRVLVGCVFLYAALSLSQRILGWPSSLKFASSLISSIGTLTAIILAYMFFKDLIEELKEINRRLCRLEREVGATRDKSGLDS